MVTRWGTTGLGSSAGWVLFVVALGAGCGASRRSVEDEAGNAGEGGVAAGVGGGKAGGRAGRSATGATGGASTNAGNGTSGGSTNEGGTDASGGTQTEETGGTTGGLGGRGGRGGTGAGGGSDAGAGGSAAGEDGSGGALGGGSGGNGGTTGVQCDWADVTTQLPTVVLLVDASTSMWEVMPPAWNLLQEVLMHPEQGLGVVATLTDHVRFGLASYKGHQAAAEDDPACATMSTVAPAFSNRAAMDVAFGAIEYSETERWETPTNYAINRTAASLLDDTEAPGKKYILLFTDGNPNTCRITDPQCGQDLAVRATQDAFASGIGLLVVGVGDIVGNPNGGCPASARCGEDHLQDLANAGVGAPVMPPPNCDDPTSDSCTYRFEACVEDNVLKASYTPGAAEVGTPGVPRTTGIDDRDVFFDLVTGMIQSLIPCTFELSKALDPAIAVVNIGGVDLTLGDADGFELDGTELTLGGAACDSYRNGYDLAVHGACSDGS